MFSTVKKISLIANKKYILILLLFASPFLFIATSCGTWDKGITGPMASLTLTSTPAGTLTPINTPSNTPTNTATATIVAACPNPAAVVLGAAGNYVLLAETGITDVSLSTVTGNVGNSPGSGTQILITCPEVTGTVYAVDAAGPDSGCDTVDPSDLTTAISNMGTAYTTANGLPYCVENLGAGTLSGITMTRGVYNWTSDVDITTDIYLDALGDSTAIWVFQIAGNLTLANSTTIHLENGALAQNVFWTVAGTSSATLGANSQFVGVLMVGPACLIAVQTNASVNGRLLSQTAITLQKNLITHP